MSDSENGGVAVEEVPKGCCSFFCHPKGAAHRFIILIFLCFLGFGSYFCFDNPAALKTNIEEDLKFSNSKYGMLYSMYSWPNVVLCFVGGFLIDSVFGIRLGTNIFMGLTLAGQIVFAMAVYYNIYWLMLAGRFIFGIGAESLAVAQNNYAVLWFKGKELNMVFGLQLSFARIGSTVNFWVMQRVYTWVSDNITKTGSETLGISLYIATGTCLFSMFCAIALGIFDKRAERITKRNENKDETEVVRLTDVKDFKSTFWLLTVVCVTYYVAIFPFISFVQNFFMEKFNLAENDANQVASIVYLISGFASPILGLMIDKIGKNIFFIIVAISSTIFAHSLITFTALNPYIGMSIMGVSYSALASSLWPLVSQIIPEYQLGTAYGVCQAVQNLGLALMTIVAGVISDNYGFKRLEYLFICCLVLALVATIFLWSVDLKQNGTLNMTPGQRRWFFNRNGSIMVSQNDESTEDLADNIEPIGNSVPHANAKDD